MGLNDNSPRFVRLPELMTAAAVDMAAIRRDVESGTLKAMLLGPKGPEAVEANQWLHSVEWDPAKMIFSSEDALPWVNQIEQARAAEQAELDALNQSAPTLAEWGELLVPYEPMKTFSKSRFNEIYDQQEARRRDMIQCVASGSLLATCCCRCRNCEQHRPVSAELAWALLESLPRGSRDRCGFEVSPELIRISLEDAAKVGFIPLHASSSSDAATQPGKKTDANRTEPVKNRNDMEAVSNQAKLVRDLDLAREERARKRNKASDFLASKKKEMGKSQYLAWRRARTLADIFIEAIYGDSEDRPRKRAEITGSDNTAYREWAKEQKKKEMNCV